jgi:DNA-binding NarL/FixJ family response regulator
VAELEQCPQPFETARSWLVLGQVRRRAKQKLPARVAFERSRGMFADLGARLWLERTEAELRRIGGRPTTRFELTETETQVASLVARGMTNQEVADSLFVSVATVHASLKHIYSKVGVRSRTELAIRLGQPDVTDQ